MLEFISIPLVVGIVTLGIYKLFELFVRKKERLLIIEKVGEKFDASMVDVPFRFPVKFGANSAYGTLKAACLLIGVGLGLLIGFIIVASVVGPIKSDDWEIRQTISIIYGASVLLFGGLGLLTAFLLEIKLEKEKK